MVHLPVEIVQQIFLEICSSQTIFPLHKNEPRLLITRVCSQWRAIALSTPILWAKFYIHVWDYSTPQHKAICAWIYRTAQSTLSFEFHSSTRRFETSPMIVDLVFPVIHRCSSLSLHLNTATLNQLLSLPPNSLRALQSILVLVQDDARVADLTPFATAFQSCPQLRTFGLSTHGPPGHHPENLKIANFNVPWHQLTNLRLYSPSILSHESLDIIRQCTSLEECDASISTVDSSALQRIIELSHHPVTLPSLHTLRIEFADSGNDNFRFLHALRLPCLRIFRPELPMWTSTHPASWSMSVLQSVLCDTIQELDFSIFPIPESLSDALARVPSLKTLWLNDDSHEYPGLIRALGKGSIVPCLTTLHLGCIKSCNFLFDILEARVAAARVDCGITAFVNVTTLGRGDGPLNQARLVALMETGMQITFNRT